MLEVTKDIDVEQLEEIIKDPEKTAEIVGLVYYSDNNPGIQRVKKGQEFIYLDPQGNRLQDKEVIGRCKKLVLPPAWTNVWICPDPRGHLQATGVDTKNRKQYRYHPEWNKIRSETKYFRMIQFGNMLPTIRERVKKDLSSTGLTEQKVLALVVSLMERTAIRVGNESYKKLYGSFGLTTLRDKHVEVNGSTIKFDFKGKKGVYQSITLKSRKLAQLVKKCRDIPGYELFQYYDSGGSRKCIDSGSVNNYLKEITGCDFSAKDFRTWVGTVNALRAFREIGGSETKTEVKKNVIKAIDLVSETLGNTRTVCKKYYIHPAVINAYESGCLVDYFKELTIMEEGEISKTGLTCEEELMMKILQTIKINDAEELKEEIKESKRKTAKLKSA